MPDTINGSNTVNIIINGTSRQYDNLSSEFLEKLDQFASEHDLDVIIEVITGPYIPAE
jgi:hypothetical protein